MGVMGKMGRMGAMGTMRATGQQWHCCIQNRFLPSMRLLPCGRRGSNGIAAYGTVSPSRWADGLCLLDGEDDAVAVGDDDFFSHLYGFCVFAHRLPVVAIDRHPTLSLVGDDGFGDPRRSSNECVGIGFALRISRVVEMLDDERTVRKAMMVKTENATSCQVSPSPRAARMAAATAPMEKHATANPVVKISRTIKARAMITHHTQASRPRNIISLIYLRRHSAC